MGTGLELFLMAAGTAATAYTAHEGAKAAKSQADAQVKAAEAMKQQAIAAGQKAATTKPQEARKPSYEALYTKSGMAGGGNASTMLTGSQGIDPSTLNLGKNTLLGE
jgi:hypothetical protein